MSNGGRYNNQGQWVTDNGAVSDPYAGGLLGASNVTTGNNTFTEDNVGYDASYTDKSDDWKSRFGITDGDSGGVDSNNPYSTSTDDYAAQFEGDSPYLGANDVTDWNESFEDNSGTEGNIDDNPILRADGLATSASEEDNDTNYSGKLNLLGAQAGGNPNYDFVDISEPIESYPMFQQGLMGMSDDILRQLLEGKV